MKKIVEKIIIPAFLVVAVLVTAVLAVPAYVASENKFEYTSEIESGSESETESESGTDSRPDFEESKFGDANDDGRISAADARLILRCAADLEKTSEHILTYCDYNSDGRITSADARMGLRVAATLENIVCILHGHDYKPMVVAPGCTDDGYTTGKCARCPAVDGTRADIVPAIGHVLETNKKDATCTSSGWLTVRCAVCGYTETDGEDGEAFGHSFSEWVRKGNTRTRACSRCGYEEKEQVQSNKIVYLTFDDGPGAYTERLLNTLRKYDVKATFFVTNQFPNYIHLLKTMADDGHAIGVHTLTHSFSIYSSETSYMRDFNAMHDIIKKQTGIDTKIFRFPGGTNNTVSRKYCRGIMSTLAARMANNGYYCFDWNVDCRDTSGYNSSQIASTTISQIKNQSVSIVLMHDIKKATVDAMPAIIEYCLNNGYVFEVLDETSPSIRFKPVN